jgi:hypothetical protein
MQNVHHAAEVMRTSLAIVTATLERDNSTAQVLAAELDADDAQFGVLILAELLTQALYDVGAADETPASDVWQYYCRRAEDAAQRATSQFPGC